GPSRPESMGFGGQHGISRATYRSARQKESRSPKPHLAQESREEKSHHTQSSSSPASGPLQDTWKLLDLGSSPSGLTSQDDSVPVCPPPSPDSLRHPDGSPVGAQAALAIEGVKTEAQAKARPARTARAHPAETKCCQRPPKIRNYNLKD
uniref:Coiled-coil domain containing 57 n=1 Tax=Panthera leo TaxID=9689 RepID=A0A8C9D658_PANLE